jgi:hypothetical protein
MAVNRDALAVIAQETAHQVGCKALCWWQDPGDPRRLHIAANLPLPQGRTRPVHLEAIVERTRERDSSRLTTLGLPFR